MDGLSLLALRRRTWFLERVLKLGLVQIAKEYECVRPKLSSDND
jgi:hypothetical protein